jgi:pimeloyl-ACP methyl ester carboxylesterase
MRALADRWRLVAPDQPGFGYTATPSAHRFGYTFDAHAAFLQRFTDVLGLTRYALYLHDYGSQFGLRLALAAPERVAALVIQNGDIYEDEHGPKYGPLKAHWGEPIDAAPELLGEAVTEEGFRDEFVGEIPQALADRVSPDTWTLSWALLRDPARRAHLATLLADQPSTLAWFPRQQAYLRDHRPQTLIVWGPHDGYMPVGAAQAYLRDVLDAELHLLDGGHWLLETHSTEVAALCREFLGRVHAG